MKHKDEMITLVENGSSDTTVVIASDIGQYATEAVHDMVRLIAKMSGATLSIVTDENMPESSPQIHIGRTTFVKEEGLIPDDLPVNGYRLCTIGASSIQRLVIAANTSLGISHGIYELLTNELGVLWGMADMLFEDVPERRTVTIKTLDRTEKPSFGFRVFSGVESNWIRRNRIDNGSRQLPFYGHGHNLFNVLPPSKYGAHSEYYAMRDGERKVPEKDGHTPIQPCLTNPDVIKITIETVRKFFDENPNVSTYSLCPNDSAKFCECSSCSAFDDGMETYRGRKMNSDSYFYYIDTVARELSKSHPDRYISAYAYWTTELPPRKIDQMPSNVVIYLTQDSSQYYDSAYEKRDRGILEKWSKVAHHLAVYDYYGLGWFTPRFFPHIVARTLPFLPTVGVKGFYCESYPYWAHIGPQLYLASRLLWDTSLDADVVLDEWYERMFKEVATEMRRFFETLERGWTDRTREGKWFIGLDWLCMQLVEWHHDVRNEAWKQLNIAYNAAESEITRRRVDYVRQGNRLAYLLSKTLEEVHALKADQSNLESALRDIFASVKKTMTLYHSKIESDPTYGSAYYRSDNAITQLMWWKGYMASVIGEVLAKKPELHQHLATEACAEQRRGNGTYREMIEAMTYPDIPRRIKEAREIYGRSTNG